MIPKELEPQLENIKKAKLTDQIFHTLRELILSGQWPAGYKLPSEPELAGRFGVSRMSLRMSLQKLNALGLIDVRVGSGTYVKDFSLNEYLRETGTLFCRGSSPRDIAEFRRALEGQGVALAIARYTPAQLETLKARLDAFYDALTRQELGDYAQRDIDFHMAIMEMSGNPLFVSTYNLCMEMLREYLEKRRPKPLPKDFDFSDDWHTRIYRAIAEKNTQEAQRLCEETIDHSLRAWEA